MYYFDMSYGIKRKGCKAMVRIEICKLWETKEA